MKKITELLTSRKFWLMVSACAGIWAAEGKAGLWKITAIVSAWIGTQGAVDIAAMKASGQASTEAPKP